MKPTPFLDIQDLPVDGLIYCTQGTIQKVFERKSGTVSKGQNKGKPWSLQNLVLVDDAGTEMGVVIRDREDELPKNWQGKTIRLESFQTQRGWSGVKAIDDDFQGKVTCKIQVTKSGDISLVYDDGRAEKIRPGSISGGENHAPAKQQHQQQQKPQSTQGQKQPPATPKTENAPSAPNQKLQGIQAAVAAANQVANLQMLCLTTVEEYVRPRFEAKTGRTLTPEEAHAWAMNMQIELSKMGQLHNMPPTRLAATPKQATGPASAPANSPANESYGPAKGGAPTHTPSGKPWPAGALPCPDTGEPVDPETGAYIF